MSEIKYIFWTGGWDSTFRLLQLARKNIEIQPIYIYDKNRAGRIQEQKAMEKILSIMQRKTEFIAQIQPAIVYDKDFILQNYSDKKITAAWRRFNAEFLLGGQYEWIAMLCKKLGIKAEFGMENSERNKAMKVMNTHGGGFIKNEEGLLEINPEKCDKDAEELFRFYQLGITDLTKRDMYNISKKNRWLKIMKNTWFCHTPINGKPCGLCNPCKDIMNEDMKFRMPWSSKIRYYKSLKIGHQKSSLKQNIKKGLKRILPLPAKKTEGNGKSAFRKTECLTNSK